MYGTHSLTPSRHLLAFMVAALCCGQAMAEMAGRVNFVMGTVSAISVDGTKRTLSKSDLVYGGDRLETDKGRLQIRFTDGSFMSFQPNTIFRLDRYNFNKAAPEQGSLQFNFLRGGMRTVTGAIGKVNRANYTVRSPVATIGIRGTGYASTMDKGILTLSVDKGIVNLSNEFGSSNINVGQTFQVKEGEAPHAAPDGMNANALAQGPEKTYEQTDDPLAELTKSLSDRVMAGESVIFRDLFVSNVLPDSFYPPSSGTPQPAYSVGSLYRQDNGSLIVANVGGFFIHDSADANLGALVQLTKTSNSTLTTIFNAGTTSNSIKFNQVTTLGELSFGEWTNGQAANGQLNRTNGTIDLGVDQFEPYIIGVASSLPLAMDNQGNAVKLGYSMAGGTIARSSNGEIGTLQRMNIDVTLAPIPLVDIDFSVAMNETGVYSAAKNNIVINNHNSNAFSGFQIESTDLSATGQGCPTTGCPITLAAFMAGLNQQMGVVYDIDRPNAAIGGVAALDAAQTGTAHNQLANQTTPSNAAIFVNNNDQGLRSESHISTDFASNGNLVNAAVNVDSTYGTTNLSPNSTAAASTEVTHLANTLSWGRWLNGTINYGNGNQLTLNDDGVHYIVGTPVTNFPTAKLSYSLVGGTNPTLAANGSLIATNSALTSGTVTVDFATHQTALDLGMNFGLGNNSTQLTLSGTGNQLAGNLSFDQLTVNVGNNNGTPTSCSNCSASAAGIVAGTNADMVGLGYHIQGATVLQTTNTSISGVGAFANSHPVN